MKMKREDQTVNRPSSRGMYLARLSKLRHQRKNQTEERNKPAEKIQQKMVNSVEAAGESATAGGNHAANRHVEKSYRLQKSRTNVRILEERVVNE